MKNTNREFIFKEKSFRLIFSSPHLSIQFLVACELSSAALFSSAIALSYCLIGNLDIWRLSADQKLNGKVGKTQFSLDNREGDRYAITGCKLSGYLA